MEKLEPLYNHDNKTMRIAGLMSGSGSNLIKIIEHEKNLEKERGRSVYHVAVIFSDNSESNAIKIGKEYDIPVIVRDKKSFYKKRHKPLKDLDVREEFDRANVHVLSCYQCPVAAYAGYMSIATSVLVNTFLGINVHPADLSIVDSDGKRKYTGDHAVRDAIFAGEKALRSSTHIIEPEVDYGRILMVSQGLVVDLPEVTDLNNKEQVNKLVNEHQSLLKEKGDWIIFPKTLEYIADQRFEKDFYGNLYFDGERIPNGVRQE